MPLENNVSKSWHVASGVKGNHDSLRHKNMGPCQEQMLGISGIFRMGTLNVKAAGVTTCGCISRENPNCVSMLQPGIEGHNNKLTIGNVSAQLDYLLTSNG